VLCVRVQCSRQSQKLICGFPTPTVEYGGGGIFSGNGTTHVWASGNVLVDGGQAGSILQLLPVICRLKWMPQWIWISDGVSGLELCYSNSMFFSGQPVLNMGFEWDTNEMSVLIAAKLGGPLRGTTARIIINSIHVKGDVCVHDLSYDYTHSNQLLKDQCSKRNMVLSH